MEPAQRQAAADLRRPRGADSQVPRAGRRASDCHAGRRQAHARLGPSIGAVRSGDSRQGELPPHEHARSARIRRQAKPTRHRGSRAQVLRPRQAIGGDARGAQAQVRRRALEPAIPSGCQLRRSRGGSCLGRLHREDLVQVRRRRGHAKARRRRTPDGHVPSHGRGQGGGRGRRRGHGSAQAEQADLRLFRSRAAPSDDGLVRRERSALELCQRRDAEGDDHTDDGRRHGPRARGERERRRQEGGVLGLERAGHRVGGFGRNIVKAGAEAADARTRRRRALRRGAPPGHHRERRFRRRRHRVERGQRRQATQADPAAAERSGCERSLLCRFPARRSAYTSSRAAVRRGLR